MRRSNMSGAVLGSLVGALGVVAALAAVAVALTTTALPPAAQQQVLRERMTGAGWRVDEFLAAMPSAGDFYFDSVSQVHVGQWHRGRVVLLGDAGYCGSPLTGLGTPQGDGYDLGYYGLIGYRFDVLWSVMPFAFYEQELPLVPGLFGDIAGVNVGVNFRPTSTVVLKLQGAYAGPLDLDSAVLKANVYVATSQVAWVF